MSDSPYVRCRQWRLCKTTKCKHYAPHEPLPFIAARLCTATDCAGESPCGPWQGKGARHARHSAKA